MARVRSVLGALNRIPALVCSRTDHEPQRGARVGDQSRICRNLLGSPEKAARGAPRLRQPANEVIGSEIHWSHTCDFEIIRGLEALLNSLSFLAPRASDL